MGQIDTTSENRYSVSNSFPVYAIPSSGFFGLTQLQTFMQDYVEPHVQVRSQGTMIMDFSTVQVWDISSLLWLVVALDYCRRDAGLSFRLLLPEGKKGMSDRERIKYDKSANYLRRWPFDRGLKAIYEYITKLL